MEGQALMVGEGTSGAVFVLEGWRSFMSDAKWHDTVAGGQKDVLCAEEEPPEKEKGTADRLKSLAWFKKKICLGAQWEKTGYTIRSGVF